MNKRQNEVENKLLSNEQQVLDKLRENYAKALYDIKRNIKGLIGDELTKSKIYQLEYQKNLYKQISSVVNHLKDESITNITDYLKKSYEDSFIGTLYNMQGEGVPLIFDINQSEVLNIINKPTEDFQLSKTLYKNANKLKKTLQNEISRGISNGSSYIKIAQQLSNSSEADLHQSYRIARTEGGRVQSEAKYKSMQLAKDSGADIVKQWDSAMDRKTRKSHRELDGQIRELDEPFEIGGHSAMYPRGFGIASEDVNCRCTLLERARWGLDDEDIQKLDNENKIIIKSDSYNDFKAKYNNIINNKIKYNTVETNESLEKFENDSNIWYNNITKEEKSAIDEYTYGGYEDINSYLSDTNNSISNMDNFAKDLDSAISKFKLDSDITVFRGDSLNNISNIEIGDVITKKMYTSTSLKKDIAEDFIFKKDNGILIKINVKKGTKCAYLGNNSAYDQEWELLLGRDIDLKLVSKNDNEYIFEVL